MYNAFWKRAIQLGTLSPFAALLFFFAPVQAAEQPVFGPVTYDVKERYGRENRYPETVAVSPGLYLIKIQNGDSPVRRPNLLTFSVNGETLLKEREYGYPFIACFVHLKTTNAVELAIRDFMPSPFKKPPLSARNAVVTVYPATVKMSNAALGVHIWDDVRYYVDSLLKIRSSEAQALAITAADLKNDPTVRADAMMKLALRKDPDVRDLILNRYFDLSESSEVRGAAVYAIGVLGETAAIPMITQGMLDPDEHIRLGSVRALALFNEQETRAPLVKALAGIERSMRPGIVRTFVTAGWRPAGALLELAAYADPDAANLGIALLAGSTEKTAVDALLAYLDNPGPRGIRLIITALGESKDHRAVEPLLKRANDPALGRGLELELCAALASLGDPRAADVIAAMIKRTDPRYQDYYRKLLDSYKKLTGSDYNQDGKAGGKQP